MGHVRNYHHPALCHAFAHVFGDMLKINTDARKLATKVLERLSSQYELDLDITLPIIPRSFLGAHLGTDYETPAVVARHEAHDPYLLFENQAHTYLDSARKAHIPIIYAARGNATDIQRFRSLAAGSDLSVADKHFLLESADRDKLWSMTWDQQALVDFLVVQKGQKFGGVGHSSFSWNVALKREEFAHAMPRLETLEGEEQESWSDGLSTLWGVRRGYVNSAGCVWP